MTTSTRTASRSPRLKRPAPSPPTVPAALRDDPSTTAESHPQHFLERVLRCQGQDLDRAMRLYHHSDVVRRLVPELMDNLLPGHQRAAIPLRQQPPCPHIVITRDGSFVTCLGPQMGLGQLPLLPYAPLDHEIAQVELLTGRRKRLQSIHAALPLQKLARALQLGPGALTREMVEIIEKDPWAYEVLIYHSYLLATDYIHHWAKLKAKHGYRPKLQAEYFKREAVLRQCAFLIGALEGPVTESLEVMLMTAYSPVLWEFVSAVARKPGRGHVLLRGMEPSGMFPEWVRAAAFDGLLMHCAWYPQEALWIVPKLRGLPPPTAPASWYRDWAVQADALTPEQCAARFQATWEDVAPRRHLFEGLVPDSPFWDFAIDEVIKWSFLRWPVSRWFPPAGLAGEVSRAFGEHLRNPPRKDPELKPVKPIVRSAPRVERNAPCPCGSGVKYKRCCGADLPRSEQAAISASVLPQQ